MSVETEEILHGKLDDLFQQVRELNAIRDAKEALHAHADIRADVPDLSLVTGHLSLPADGT